MKKLGATALTAGLLALPVALAAPAAAAKNGTYEVPLAPLNDSSAHGTALLDLEGTALTVDISAHGLVPNQPHAQHLHGGTTGKDFTCPTPAEVKAHDDDGNGILSTSEAADFYGPIMIALTTSGDTTMGSGLAIDRFPKADAKGDLTYHRVIRLSPALAKNLTNLHIVQHGIDGNHSGTYDGTDQSDLDPSLPAEATDPADCGALEPSQLQGSPVGAVATGGGDATTALPTWLPWGVGGSALAALAAVSGAYAVRRRPVARPGTADR